MKHIILLKQGGEKACESALIISRESISSIQSSKIHLCNSLIIINPAVSGVMDQFWKTLPEYLQ